jgi:CheY-like chemotaxis protein
VANPNVFISGTSGDLIEYLQAVRDVAHAFDLLPTLLDTPDPLSAEDVRLHLDAVDQAGIYIGVLANRYGPCPQGSELSIIEMTFDRALRNRIPRYCFLLDRHMPWPQAHIEGEPGSSKLRRLRSKMKNDAETASFTTPESLQVEVARTLRSVRRQRPHIELVIEPYTIIDVLPPVALPGMTSSFKVQLTCREQVEPFQASAFRNTLSRLLKLPKTEINLLGTLPDTQTIELALPTRPALKLHSLAFQPHPAAVPQAKTTEAKVFGQGERILIIDDNPQLRQTIAQMLKPHAYELLFAENGLSGLEKAQQAFPDLILLDLQMPDIDGIEVVDRLKSGHINIPVILMTGHGTESIAVEVFRKGVKDYLIKDFTEQELLQAIEERGLVEHRLRKRETQLLKRTGQLTAQLKNMTQGDAAVEANQQLERSMQIINSIGKSVTELIDIPHLLSRLVGAALLATAGDDSTLYLMQNAQLMRSATIRAGDRVPNTTAVPADDSIARWIVERNQIVFLTPDSLAQSKWNKKLPPMSAIGVPLALANQCIGALVVRKMGAEAPPFSRFQATVLSILADYGAIALENAAHYAPVPDPAPLEDWSKLAAQNPIFISYSREDWKEFVHPLVKHLEQQGFNVWVDQHLLQGGQDWLDKINEALSACSLMILCVSPAALKSPYVKLEYRYFIHERKPLIPLVCKSARLPAELVSIQHLQYGNLSTLTSLLKQLTSELGHI